MRSYGSARGWRGGRLVDPDKRRPQEAIVIHVSWLDDVRDAPRRMPRIVRFEDRLVPMRVELLAERIKTLEAMSGERVEKGAPRRLDPGQQTGDDEFRTLVLRHARDGTLQIIDRGQQIPGKARGRVSHGCIAIPLGLAANVFLLGKRAQQAILHRRQF